MKAPGDPVVFHDCPWCKLRYLGIAGGHSLRHDHVHREGRVDS